MNTFEFLGSVRNGLLGRRGSKNVSLRYGLAHQYVPSLERLRYILVTNDWKDDRRLSKTEIHLR